MVNVEVFQIYVKGHSEGHMIKNFGSKRKVTGLVTRNTLQEQDKSSDIEQQPPFGDRKISNIQPQNRGGVT